ncbi:hypothetical protein ACFQ4C_09200 [Larkinella insperata]|uniref:Uncharacterized protein n=1 Tax=Larkinella insperata TaxID=332158 RepID=A0ABW3QI19_9BACT|nr:hypothetical protein [Larkinella insperata]
MHFNHEKFDYWPIYDSIKAFYPIGIPKGDGYEMYQHYPGLKKLESLVFENIHQDGNYTSRWHVVEKTLADQTGNEVVGTTYGQVPSFSARLILKKIPSGNLTRYQELFFTVSLLEPYYTVLGRDVTEIVLQDEDAPYPSFLNKRYCSTTILTLAPENEYADVFKRICALMEESFDGYRFVPYSIYSQPLPGLEVNYRDQKQNTIFHGLFNDQVDLNAQTIGDEFYKSEDWIREGYDSNNEGGWVIYPPTSQFD